MRVFTFVLSLLLAGVIGCGSDPAESLDADAGRGEIANMNPELDSGPPGLDDCELLVQRTCGPSSTECGDSASCVAALLLQRYEAERCGAALASPDTYEECTADACTKLMQKTCGASPEPQTDCEFAPGCALTQDLYDASRDDDASHGERSRAREACAVGLEDGVVFPACGI